MGHLSKVTTGKIKSPILALIYGTDGVGKSTFAADAPSPIFIGPERNKQLDVARMPIPNSFVEVGEMISELAQEKHEHKTLVIDSLDWIEPMVWTHVCNTNGGCRNIEEVGGGFGKGYVIAQKEWLRLIGTIRYLQDKTGMNVIAIAHADVKAFTDPSLNASYDKYSVKLNSKAAALWREFVDDVLFAKRKVFVSGGTEPGKKGRAFGDGARVMYTDERPGFYAKTRNGLPFEMPLSWDEYVAGVELHAALDPTVTLSYIADLMATIKDEKFKQLVGETVEKAKGNAASLEKILNRLRAKQEVTNG